MSLDQLPDEVLVKILRFALISDKPITTSIKAYNIYQMYLDCIALSSGPPRNHTDFNTQLSERPPRGELPISPLLLGTNRRCYRLGSLFFYRTNTFTMHRELGPFAKQIGFHNSKSIHSVELTIHHKDLHPIPKISLLTKGYYKQVESVKVILSKHHKIHKNGLTATHKAQEWTSVMVMMMKKKGRELREKVEMQQRQGAGWKFAGKGELAVVHQKADHGILSERPGRRRRTRVAVR